MKKLLILFVLFSCKAYSLDLEFNMFTQHYFENCVTSERFENKVSDCGRGISNPIIGLKGKHWRGFVGQNSVGSPMVGVSHTNAYNILLGAYLQDVKEFKKRDLMPVAFYEKNDIALTPIFGYDLNIRYKKVKVFTIITPILFTTGVGFSF